MTILLVTMLVLYLGGIILPPCLTGKPRAQNVFAHGLAGLASGAGILLGIAGLFASAPLTLSLPSTLPLLTFAIRLDPLAALFVLTISLVGLAASIYAFGYVTEFYGRASIAVLGSLFNGFLLAMILVVIADNGFFFLIVWELMSLLSYFLVVTEHEKAEVRYAGLFYLIMTHVGTAFIILAFLIFFQAGGSFSFEAFRHPEQPLSEGMRTLVFLMALIGFGTKAGIVPLHVWLPYAHPAAPSHISALMSGVMIKTAIYALVRVYFDFLGGQFPWWWGFVVLVIGAVSALLGVMYALMEHDLKSLLAYHSVENIGIILLGIGAGMIFQTYGLTEFAALGLLAGLYHTINHAMFKALLFLGAGSLLYATHTRNMEEYGGLLRRMPWTGICFFDRVRVDFRLASHQRIRQRVAGLPKSLPQFSHPNRLAETHASACRGDAGPDQRVGSDLLRQGIRDLFFGPATELPCATGGGSADHHAYRDGHAGGGLRVARPRAHGRRPDVGPGGLTICGHVDRGKSAGAGWLGAGPGECGILQPFNASLGSAAGGAVDARARARSGVRWSCEKALLQDLGLWDQPHAPDGIHRDRLCSADQASLQHALSADGEVGDGVA